MSNLFSKSRWAANRAEYLDAARRSRETLTDPSGFWRYASDDQRVKDAVAFWIHRARNAHAFALGRKPVIENAIIGVYGATRQGAIYAE